MTVSLRPYQTEALDALWSSLFGEDNTLCVLPTGAGKTRVLAALILRARAVKPDIRIAVLMGRVDLVAQTERAFREFMPASTIGVLCGSFDRRETDRLLTLVSIQSVKAKEAYRYDLIIVDEVHRMDQDEGGYIRFIESCRQQNFKLKVVGVTATPFRASGLIYGRDQLFGRICYRKTIPQMIEMGFLSPPRLVAGVEQHNVSGLRLRGGEYVQEDVDALVADKERCREQVREALKLLGGRQCVVWACANIEHCNLVADTLMALGEPCTTVHSKLKRETRADNLSGWMGGFPRHMSFVSVLSEGFDHPPIDAVVLMRPMRSPVLYIQTVGRGLRLSEDKKDCLVLDFGQVVATIGPLDDPSIAKNGGQRERDGQLKLVNEPVQRMCDKCRTFVPPRALVCSGCGADLPALPTPVSRIDQRPGTGSLLSSDRPAPKPETAMYGPVRIGLHQAKSGNTCVRVVYEDQNIVTRWGYGGVSEFFVTTNAWAMERLERRLDNLGVSLPPLHLIPDEGIEVPGQFEVTTLQDGKYERVQRVLRVSHETAGKAESSIGFGDETELEELPF